MSRAWRRVPLWLRLIGAVLVLAWLGLTLTGLFGARLLRGYLVDRVDEQLGAATRAFTGGPLAAGDAPDGGLPSQFHVTGIDAEGTTVWRKSSALTRSEPDLPALTPDEAVDRGGRPFTVDATRGAGSWRAVALPLADGSGTVVLATDLGEVQATVDRLVKIDVLVGLAVLAGLAVVGYSMVRTALRPLA